MKTGTTYLQNLMSTNQDVLAEAGFLFPGTRWHDQSRAVRDVLGFSTDDPRRAAETRGKWAALTEQLLGYRGQASIVSMEFLSFADETQAARVAQSLSDADLHVILTVRDATTAIPTQWQTGCRNGKQVPLRRFLSGARKVLREGEEATSSAARMLQRTQWTPRMLSTWTPLVGADRVHVITVPPSTAPPTLLWERFAAVTGIPVGLDIDTTTDSNPSLGLASTELLRRINAQIRDLGSYDYERVVKRRLAREVLAPRKALEQPILLNRGGRQLAARWNRRVRRSIETHGVELIGSLAELPVSPSLEGVPKGLVQPSQEELLTAAATGRDGLRSWVRQLATALESGDLESAILPVQLPGRDDPLGVTSPDHWLGADRPVDEAVAELCRLVRECVRLYNEVRRARESSGHELASDSVTW
jgi:hypothetical protein